MDKIESLYVASSWRNPFQVAVVVAMRTSGIRTYDFKDEEGFHWSEVDPLYNDASQRIDYDGLDEFKRYTNGLSHPRAEEGFKRDYDAMESSAGCVLVLPSGRSSHLEAGWFVAKGRPTAIYIPQFDGTWELMYKMADLVTDDMMELLAWAGVED